MSDNQMDRKVHYGEEALGLIARRALIGVTKIKPEEEHLILDETIAPLKKARYAPRALQLTEEGSLLVARRVVTHLIKNDQRVGVVTPTTLLVGPGAPATPDDIIFVLPNIYKSGILKRIRLFAAWAAAAGPPYALVRNKVQVTVYTRDPMKNYLRETSPVEPPRESVLYENFSLEVPVPFTGGTEVYESIIDEAVELPYAFDFGLQSVTSLTPRTSTPPQGELVSQPQMWIRLSGFTKVGETVNYEWRVTIEDGGR